MAYARTYFRLSYESLHWGFLDEDDFILGPGQTGSLQELNHRLIASKLSQTVDRNSTLISLIDKKANGGPVVTN